MDTFSSWTIRRQLNALLGLNLVVVLVLAGTGLSGLWSLSEALETIGLKRVPDMMAFEGLNRERMAIRAQTMEALALSKDARDVRADFERLLRQRAASWKEVETDWATPSASGCTRTARC